MSKIRSKDTNIELRVRKALHSAGFRFRLHRKDLPGSPDLVLPKYSTAVFVNGCFWHGHDCKKAKIPATNIEFWKRKIETNISRDKKNKDLLEEAGWYHYVIWECRLEEETLYLINHFLEE